MHDMIVSWDPFQTRRMPNTSLIISTLIIPHAMTLFHTRFFILHKTVVTPQPMHEPRHGAEAWGRELNLFDASRA